MAAHGARRAAFFDSYLAATLYHYRTEDGLEVDAVLETLAENRLVAGYILNTGQQTLPFGERIRAVPMDALWRMPSPSASRL